MCNLGHLPLQFGTFAFANTCSKACGSKAEQVPIFLILLILLREVAGRFTPPAPSIILSMFNR
jgi:hypothetical protein